MLIKKSIPNLINGISQQAPNSRLITQCQEEINGFNSAVTGLSKRSCTETKSVVCGANSNAFTYFIKRDTEEKYIAIIANNTIKVFDMDGVEKTVTIKEGAEKYLTTTNPLECFDAVTIADYTFIVNKDRYCRIKKSIDDDNLIPIYEYRQVITLNKVPPNSLGWYIQEGTRESSFLDPSVAISAFYAFTINGYEVKLMPERVLRRGSRSGNNKNPIENGLVNKSVTEEPSLNEFKDLLIKYLEETLNYKCSKGYDTLNIVTDKELDIKDVSEVWTCLQRFYFHSPSPINRSNWNDAFRNTSKPYRVIIGNETKKVLIGYETEDGDLIPPNTLFKREAIVFVKIGNYSSDYIIFIDDIKVSYYTTPDSDKSKVATNFIAGELFKKLDENEDLTAKYIFSFKGSVIKIESKNTDIDFKIRTEDSMSDLSLSAIKETTADLSDLPKTCFDSFTVQINSSDNDETGYYVKYVEDKTGGYWEETKKRGLNNILVASSMPHRLISHADETFTFEAIEWAKRNVGDIDSAPDPSFINQRLNSIFFYENRLAFLSDENIIFSENSDYYNFYPSTVRTNLAGDYIDISVTTDTVAILKQCCLFNQRLLLFSDTMQFVLNYENVLTLSTVSLNPVTRFNALLKAKPVVAGNFVYFAFKRGLYSGIYEYYVDVDSKVNRAIDITAHAPEYIKGEVTAISVCAGHNTIAVLSNGESDAICVYNYYSDGNDKLQSSWSKWKINGNVVSIDDYDSGFILVVKRDNKLFIEIIDLSSFNEPISKGFSTEILLDRRKLIQTGSIIPDYLLDEDWNGVNKNGDLFNDKNKSELVTSDGKAKETCYIGYPYLFYYQFNPFILNELKSNNTNIADKLRIKRFHLDYYKSGDFNVIVLPSNRNQFTKPIPSRVLSARSNVLDEPVLTSGTLKTHINCNANDLSIIIYNMSYLPCNFQSASWDGVARIIRKSI